MKISKFLNFLNTYLAQHQIHQLQKNKLYGSCDQKLFQRAEFSWTIVIHT